FVVNRVLGRRLGMEELSSASIDTKSLEKTLSTTPPEALRVLRATYEQLTPRLEHEVEAARFLASLSGTVQGRAPVALVAEQPTDVHSVGALVGVSRQLG